MASPERFKIHIAAYLALQKDGEVLLSRRFNTGYRDGEYSLVARHLDGGETAKQSIIREAREEAGITLNPQDLTVAHIMHRYRPDREYIDIFLTAEKWTGSPQNMEPDKCDDLRWFNLKNLPNNLLPEVRQALDAIIKGEFYGEFGWDDKR
jgi:8-oxo-dGTP diphosphatase